MVKLCLEICGNFLATIVWGGSPRPSAHSEAKCEKCVFQNGQFRRQNKKTVCCGENENQWETIKRIV